MQAFSKKQTVFLTPIMFGVAHVHHLLEMVKFQGARLSSASAVVSLPDFCSHRYALCTVLISCSFQSACWCLGQAAVTACVSAQYASASLSVTGPAIWQMQTGHSELPRIHLRVTGVIPIFVHNIVWVVCYTCLSQHRTSGWCCSGAFILQLDGLPSHWRCAKSSTEECSYCCLPCWHCCLHQFTSPLH